MQDGPGSIDRPAKNSKELANAAWDDFKRKAIDEAKKRAVSQRVDYDTFKNMVLTAHLTPITAPNRRTNDRPAPCWNFGPDGKPVKEQAGQMELPSVAPVEAPSTMGDFTRDWRRMGTADDKYRYLHLCGLDTLRMVFRVEISSEVLREILGVVEACWLGHGGAAEEAEGGSGAALREAAFVVQLLQVLSAGGRFPLAVKLLGNSIKPALARLFAGLEDAAAAAASRGAGGVVLAAEEDGTGRLDVDSLTLEQVVTLQRLYGG
uniref:PR46bm n=1 Tax=Volvox carteri f. nagariensis TaxID=3068 RepID=D9CJA4_VOLCA|nr:PR46bm [Volvox carteri f. nagariensis]